MFNIEMAKQSTPKVYTKKGDAGATSLVGGQSIAKQDLRIEVYGTVDELNSVLGLLIARFNISPYKKSFETVPNFLQDIQRDLFDLGGQLACIDLEVSRKIPNLSEAHIQKLESQMDQMSLQLEPMTHFILPGGSELSSLCHIARTVCRRAERAWFRLNAESPLQELHGRFLNRLSDYFFVLARFTLKIEKIKEVLWMGRKSHEKP